MATCKVYGYIVDGSEIPLSGIHIQYVPASIPAVNSSTGQAILPRTVETYTTSTGYFETNLLVNTDFVVIINALGLKEKIRIPVTVSEKDIEGFILDKKEEIIHCSRSSQK